MSVVDTLIFNYVFIQARSPGNTVIWQELIASTTSLHSSYTGKKHFFFFFFLFVMSSYV